MPPADPRGGGTRVLGAGSTGPLGAAATVGLVAVGGAVGGAVRWSATTLSPDPAVGVHWSTWWVNGLGCFALALLVAGSGPRSSRWLRPAIGTGLLGGFTTFSAVAYGAEHALRADAGVTAAAVLAGSVAVGLVGAALGTVAGTALLRRGAGRSG